MLKILKQYTKNGMNVIEYTDNGVTASHTVETPIPDETDNSNNHQPTIEQQILAELQYNTALTEMKMLGGM